MNNFSANLKSALIKIRQLKPVIHHITNFVTINDCANITTALGASPVMAYTKEESADVTAVSKALVLNLGTPDNKRFEAISLSAKMANRLNIPIILDPVGVGATTYRETNLHSLLSQIEPSVIKGNSAEIKTLAGISNSHNNCIDSLEATANTEDVVRLAKSLSTTIAVTGETDIIADETRLARVQRGTKMFTYISGAGCMTSSVIGAFLSVEKDPFLATLYGIYSVNICGEDAAKKSVGPGDFKINFINALYNLYNTEIMEEGIFFE